jgi:hypothetical protein
VSGSAETQNRWQIFYYNVDLFSDQQRLFRYQKEKSAKALAKPLLPCQDGPWFGI